MWLLAGLGATPVADRDSADLVPVLIDDLGGLACGGGLPPGTIEWAGSSGACVAAIGSLVTARPMAASATGVAMAVRLPEVMAASYGSPVTMAPGAPMAFGDGWLHVDVGSPGDAALLQSCLASRPAGSGAVAASAEAQAWRLPVCDYRPRVPEVAVHPVSVAGGGSASADRGFRVVDLTTMWAGPMAVWLLGLLGAEVVRVEPSFRPDGFRALDGRGIHPGGAQCDPGRDSAMFNALHPDGADRTVDLDLRVAADRERFEELLAAADLVVDSFSPRVMGNLGYDELDGGATRASVAAFGPGPEQDRVAYGTGVHAASGLGDIGGGRFSPGAVSYPDPLGGLVLALGAAAAMVGRRLGRPVERVSTSLAAAVQPLLGGPALPWPAADAATGGRLLARASELGLMVARPVCGSRLLHPATIFLSNQSVF